MSRPFHGRPLAAAAALAAAVLAPQAHALAVYDDFSGGSISAFRWAGSERQWGGASSVETRRLVSAGALRLEQKTYSDNSYPSGSGRGQTALTFVRSPDITDIRATVTMRTVTMLTCPQNSTPSTVSARIEGSWFNAGGSTPGSRYNDVVAGVMFFRLSNSPDAAGVVRAIGYYGVCLDETCSTQQQFDSVALDTQGAVGTAAVLEIRWDKAAHRFVFQKDSGALATLTYTLSDTRPAQDPSKRLAITNDAANCVSTRLSAYGGADFDDVQTNALP